MTATDLSAQLVAKAWRYRYRDIDGDKWMLSSSRAAMERAKASEPQDFEYEPLYGPETAARIKALEEAQTLIGELAAKGADKAGCDGWRAQEMCRQIVQILARAALPETGEGT